MSIHVMAMVSRRRLGSMARKAVAVRLADFADEDGCGIWPSVPRLAAECELNERTVQRVLAEFVAEGLLKIVAEGGRGRRSTTRYDMALERLSAYPPVFEKRQEMAQTDDEPGENGAPQHDVSGEVKGDTVSPLDPLKGDTGSLKGDTGSRLGWPGVTQTVIEPLKNHHSPRVGAQEPAKPGERGDRQDGSSQLQQGTAENPKALVRRFKKFAPSFPSWVTSSAGRALKVWVGLDEADRLACEARTAEWCAAFRAEGKRNWPALQTYLAEKPWQRLPPAGQAQPAVAGLPAYGKAWMAYRLHLLQTLTAKQWRPTPLQQHWLDSGQNLDAVDAARRRGRWPAVVQIDEDAFAGRPARPTTGALAAGDLSPADSFVRVKRDSAGWQAWQDFHHQRGWPWINPPRHIEWIFLPAATPDQAGFQFNHETEGQAA